MLSICRDIWSRFLAFESEVGDLASILKVEKRRSQAIEKVRRQHVCLVNVLVTTVLIMYCLSC